jgi:hypothetical protein
LGLGEGAKKAPESQIADSKELSSMQHSAGVPLMLAHGKARYAGFMGETVERPWA